MKRPLLSAMAFRVSGGLSLLVGLGTAAFWMVTRSGPFPWLVDHVGAGSHEENVFGAMGLSFIVAMVPCLALILALYAASDMPSVSEEFAALRAPSVDQARRLGGERAARAYQELADVRSPDGRAATRARAFAAAGGALAGFFRQDWFSDGVRTYGAAAAGIGFGLAAVSLDRGHGSARVLQAGALALIVVGVVLPTEIYLRYREDFFLFELLIPMLTGMLPGFLLHRIVWRRAHCRSS